MITKSQILTMIAVAVGVIIGNRFVKPIVKGFL